MKKLKKLRAELDAEKAKGEAADKERCKALETEIAELEKSGKANEEEDTKSITDDDLKSLIGDVVSDQIAKSGLPEAFKKAATRDEIGALVVKAIKQHEAEEGARHDVKSIATTAVKMAMDEIRVPSKMIFGTKDADTGNRSGQVEIPCSWTKGNLPLHGKQLLNIITAPNGQAMEFMNKGIDEADLRKGKALGDRVLDQYRNIAAQAVMGTKNWKEAHKALTIAAASGSGVDFMPTDLSAELQRRFYLATELAGVFAAREINMPSETYQFPMTTTLPSFYMGAVGRAKTETSGTFEVTAATESSPGTAPPTLVAKEFVGQTNVSYAIEEDSIIPILPYIQEQLSTGAAHAFETALINGDATGADATHLANTHFDSDIEAVARHAAKAWTGFRRLSYNVARLMVDMSAAGVINWDGLVAMRKAMGKYGLDPKALIWVVGPAGAIQMANIEYVRTIKDSGQIATVIQGAIDAIMGSPIIASEYCRENLSAAGIYEAAGTKGCCLLIRPDRFLVGSRRTFMVETWRNIQTRQNVIVASFRKAFTPLETPSATVQSVVQGYNWTA